MKVEGRNAVRELVLNGTTIDRVLIQNNLRDAVITDLVDLCKNRKIRFQFVNATILNNESVTKHHQGVIAYTSEFKYSATEDILDYAKEKGEDPFEAGKRELEEETGQVAGKYYDLGEFYPTPGYCAEIIHLYAASNLTATEMHLDEDEFLNVELIPIDKALEMVMNGEIPDGKTQTLILRVVNMIKSGIIGGK